MEFDKWFKGLNRLVQVILLLIPVVNFVVELLVRLSALLRKTTPINIVMLILVFVTGGLLGFVDIFVVLFTGDLLLVES